MNNLGAIGNALTSGQIQPAQDRAQDPRVAALVQQGFPLEMAIQMVHGQKAQADARRTKGVEALGALAQVPDARNQFLDMQRTIG